MNGGSGFENGSGQRGAAAFVDAIDSLERVYRDSPGEFERLRTMAALGTRDALREFTRLPAELQAALSTLYAVPDETKQLALRIVSLPAGAREPLRGLLDCPDAAPVAGAVS